MATSIDSGIEFRMTEKQFLKLMQETMDDMKSRMELFKRTRNTNKTDADLYDEYEAVYLNYKMITDNYLRLKEKGVELIPTVKFDEELGSIAPGYRHKSSVDRYNRWFKKLTKAKNNREMYGFG